MYELIIIIHFMHTIPLVARFPMPTIAACEDYAEEILIDMRGDRFYVSDKHWCLNIWNEE